MNLLKNVQRRGVGFKLELSSSYVEQVEISPFLRNGIWAGVKNTAMHSIGNCFGNYKKAVKLIFNKIQEENIKAFDFSAKIW